MASINLHIIAIDSVYANCLLDSNTGFDILGWALQSFASSFENGLQSSTDEHYLLRNILARDVFHPLGMNSSFFHPIPDHLKPEMTVPRSDNMVDLDFGEAYDP